MRLNSGQNLHQFLTNSRSNSTKSDSKNNKIYNDTKTYNQSKSNINIINIENANKRFNLFSNLNAKQKEKINLSKFNKADRNYYNNINLVTEKNIDKKREENKLNLNISFLNMYKKGKGNSFKTLNYDRSSYVRIMKYFTIKSSNKPMEFEDLSPVLIPIRNTLSNEHRKNNLNINTDNIKEKINFYYYINSKEKVIQLFKDNKKKNKYNLTNNTHRTGDEPGGKNVNLNNTNKNINRNDSDKFNDNNKINNINLINKKDLKNNNHKGSDNNLTFSKNSNESEFTFKDKGSTVLNLDSKKSNNKDNSNNSSHNNLNSELNSFAEKDNKKINNNKQFLVKNFGKNLEIPKNAGQGKHRLSISVEKINNKENSEQTNYMNNKNNFKYNYNLINNEEEKTNNNENSPRFLNEKLFNNFINKEKNKNKKNKDEKYSNLFEKILNKQNTNKNIKLENDINNNNDKNSLNTIEHNENNDNKNNLKNSYQFRIRKINLPTGINLASIPHNNKLLQNILHKKSKKNKAVLNTNKIQVAQTEYKLIKEEKINNENKKINNLNEKKKNDKNKNIKEDGKKINKI